MDRSEMSEKRSACRPMKVRCSDLGVAVLMMACLVPVAARGKFTRYYEKHSADK